MIGITWFPVVDTRSCTECGICVNSCAHGVFDVRMAPKATVIDPAACVYQCHECGDQCPVGAIQYFGEDTDWIPPALEAKEYQVESSACDCSCEINK